MPKTKKIDSCITVDDKLQDNNPTMTFKDTITRVNIKNIIPEAPVHSSCVLPFGYSFTKSFAIVKKRKDEEYDEYVISCPLFITAISKDVIDDKETVRLAMFRHGKWKTIEVDRRYISKSNLIVDLSDDGLPITTNSVKDIMLYLEAYEYYNEKNIPIINSTTQLGWDKDLTCFLFGDECLVPKTPTCICCTNTGNNNSLNNSTIFKAKDDGERQIAKSLSCKGEYYLWVNQINKLFEFPVAIFSVYTSLTSPLLEILGVENFSYEISSPTSTGKTKLLQICASSWGNPVESSNGFLKTWKMTRTALEYNAKCRNGIPLILDDTKNSFGVESRTKNNTLPIVTDTIYMIESGIGKSRGTLSGTAINPSFKTIMMSSGESPSLDLTNDAGANGRMISLWGHPWGTTSIRIKKLISEIEEVIRNNYGQAARNVVQFILDHTNDWPIWRDAYKEVVERFIHQIGNNSVKFRILENIAAIVTAIPIIHAALPELRRDISIKSIIDEILCLGMAELEITDNGSKAIEYIKDNLNDHREILLTKEKVTNGIIFNNRIHMCYSDYDGKDWSFIGLKASYLENILNKYDLKLKEVTKTWLLNKTIISNKSSKGYQKQVQIKNSDGTKPKLNFYCLSRSAFEASGHFNWEE